MIVFVKRKIKQNKLTILTGCVVVVVCRGVKLRNTVRQDVIVTTGVVSDNGENIVGEIASVVVRIAVRWVDTKQRRWFGRRVLFAKVFVDLFVDAKTETLTLQTHNLGEIIRN